MHDAAQLWWAYLILGVVAGTCGAALGVGGGVVMVPALVIIFGFDQKIAQGTSMGAMIGIAIMGFYRYWAEPQIKISMSPVLLIGVAAVGGAFLGVKIAAALPKATLQKIFAVVMIVAAARLFWKSMRPGPEPVPTTNSAAAESPPLTAPPPDKEEARE